MGSAKSDATYVPGLEGVVAAKTRLCEIDRQVGRLFYAGYDVAELAGHAGYEEVCFLLWHGRFPLPSERDELIAELASYREAPRPVLRLLASFPRDAAPMAVLRSAVSALGCFDPDADDSSPEAALRKSKRLVALVPVLVAAWQRIRQGRDPVKPDVKLGHAADFLRQLLGRKARAEHEKLMESALVVCAEHGLNPSTFAARVTASTLTDVHAAVVAAVGALQGPLHGGASQAAMDLLLKIDDPASAEAYLASAFERKEKIHGFGHRSYETKDPRATVLERLAEPFAKRSGESRLIEVVRKVEEIVLRERKLHANAELWLAPVLHLLRLPPDLFSSVFAVARTVGWTAHVLEQRADNRLFRPAANYIGPASRPWSRDGR